MILVEDDLIQLDDPVAMYLPQFENMSVVSAAEDGGFTTTSAKRPVTIRHLLNNTSGLTYQSFANGYLAEIYGDLGLPNDLVPFDGSLSDVVDRISAAPLASHPGEAWHLGLSTHVLGGLIEVVSGQPIDVFLEERIFDPLAMNDTMAFVPDEDLIRLASIYAPGPDGALIKYDQEPNKLGPLHFSTLDLVANQDRYFAPGGQLVATADDYGRFLQMLLSQGTLDGVRLLTAESVDMITSNSIGELSHPFADSGDKMGFGVGVTSDSVAIDAIESIGSYGWGGILYTNFWSDPERDLWVLIMTQRAPPHADLKLRRDLRNAGYDILSES